MPQKIRAIAFDDGYFSSRNSKTTKLIGVIYRSDFQIEGILCNDLKVDSLDSTQVIMNMVKNSRFSDQIRYVFLSGINFSGFNIVDMQKLYSDLKLPIIVIMRKKPNFEKIKIAISRFRDADKRFLLIKKAGPLHCYKKIFFQKIGLSEKQAQHIIDTFTHTSKVPEPIRLAHIIASGITIGESTRP